MYSRLCSEENWRKPILCEQKVLSCMAFSIYKVVRVACLSHIDFVYIPRFPFPVSGGGGARKKKINYTTDKPHEQLRKC